MEANQYDIDHNTVAQLYPSAWSAWTLTNEDVSEDVFSTEEGVLWVHPGVPQDSWRWDVEKMQWVQDAPED